MSVVSFLSCFVRNLPKGSNGLLSSLFVCHRLVPKLHKLILPRKSQQDQIYWTKPADILLGWSSTLFVIFVPSRNFLYNVHVVVGANYGFWLADRNFKYFLPRNHAYIFDRIHLLHGRTFYTDFVCVWQLKKHKKKTKMASTHVRDQVWHTCVCKNVFENWIFTWNQSTSIWKKSYLECYLNDYV